MSPHFKAPLLHKVALDALLETMTTDDYDSLGAHRRGESSPESKGTEFNDLDGSGFSGSAVVIPAKDLAQEPDPATAEFFKESEPEFEMSASGIRRVSRDVHSPDWDDIQEIVTKFGYRWLGRVTDGTEMWGSKSDRIIYDPAQRHWTHTSDGKLVSEGAVQELEEKISQDSGFERKSASLKYCVACDGGDCIEHRFPIQAAEPWCDGCNHAKKECTCEGCQCPENRNKKSNTKSYGKGTPIGGTPNEYGAADDPVNDEAENAGMDMSASVEDNSMKFKSALLKKKALVEMHETPTMLPPRDDLRRHLDEVEQEAVMEGVADKPAASPRKEQISPNLNPSGRAAAKKADFDSEQDTRDEYFLDQAREDEMEAKRSFLEEDYLRQEAAERGIAMEDLWKEMKDEYMADFFGYSFKPVRDFTDGPIKTSSERCPLCKSAKNCHGFYSLLSH